MHARFHKEETPRLDRKLQLTYADQLFLHKLRALSQEKNRPLKEKQIKEAIKNYSLEGIIRIAEAYPAVKDYCKLPILNDHWKKIWCSYGLLLKPGLTFHPYSDTDHFDMVCGVYFYHQATKVRQTLKKTFSFSEKEFLKKSLNFNSIHGIQLYLKYLYAEIEHGATSHDKCEENWKEIINLCKGLVDNHGTYAYLMLCQAYFKYGAWNAQNEDNDVRDACIRAAMKAFTTAKDLYSSSQFSIYNASLGDGLKRSNDLELEDLVHIESFLKEGISQMTGKSSDSPSFN